MAVNSLLGPIAKMLARVWLFGAEHTSEPEAVVTDVIHCKSFVYGFLILSAYANRV